MILGKRSCLPLLETAQCRSSARWEHSSSVSVVLRPMSVALSTALYCGLLYLGREVLRLLSFEENLLRCKDPYLS